MRYVFNGSKKLNAKIQRRFRDLGLADDSDDDDTLLPESNTSTLKKDSCSETDNEQNCTEGEISVTNKRNPLETDNVPRHNKYNEKLKNANENYSEFPLTKFQSKLTSKEATNGQKKNENLIRNLTKFSPATNTIKLSLKESHTNESSVHSRPTTGDTVTKHPIVTPSKLTKPSKQAEHSEKFSEMSDRKKKKLASKRKMYILDFHKCSSTSSSTSSSQISNSTNSSYKEIIVDTLCKQPGTVKAIYESNTRNTVSDKQEFDIEVKRKDSNFDKLKFSSTNNKISNTQINGYENVNDRLKKNKREERRERTIIRSDPEDDLSDGGSFSFTTATGKHRQSTINLPEPSLSKISDNEIADKRRMSIEKVSTPQTVIKSKERERKPNMKLEKSDSDPRIVNTHKSLSSPVTSLKKPVCNDLTNSDKKIHNLNRAENINENMQVLEKEEAVKLNTKKRKISMELLHITESTNPDKSAHKSNKSKSHSRERHSSTTISSTPQKCHTSSLEKPGNNDQVNVNSKKSKVQMVYERNGSITCNISKSLAVDNAKSKTINQKLIKRNSVTSAEVEESKYNKNESPSQRVFFNSNQTSNEIRTDINCKKSQKITKLDETYEKMNKTESTQELISPISSRLSLDRSGSASSRKWNQIRQVDKEKSKFNLANKIEKTAKSNSKSKELDKNLNIKKRRHKRTKRELLYDEKPSDKLENANVTPIKHENTSTSSLSEEFILKTFSISLSDILADNSSLAETLRRFSRLKKKVKSCKDLLNNKKAEEENASMARSSNSTDSKKEHLIHEPVELANDINNDDGINDTLSVGNRKRKSTNQDEVCSVTQKIRRRSSETQEDKPSEVVHKNAINKNVNYITKADVIKQLEGKKEKTDINDEKIRKKFIETCNGLMDDESISCDIINLENDSITNKLSKVSDKIYIDLTDESVLFEENSPNKNKTLEDVSNCLEGRIAYAEVLDDILHLEKYTPLEPEVFNLVSAEVLTVPEDNQHQESYEIIELSVQDDSISIRLEPDKLDYISNFRLLHESIDLGEDVDTITLHKWDDDDDNFKLISPLKHSSISTDTVPMNNSLCSPLSNNEVDVINQLQKSQNVINLLDYNDADFMEKYSLIEENKMTLDDKSKIILLSDFDIENNTQQKSKCNIGSFEYPIRFSTDTESSVDIKYETDSDIIEFFSKSEPDEITIEDHVKLNCYSFVETGSPEIDSNQMVLQQSKITAVKKEPIISSGDDSMAVGDEVIVCSSVSDQMKKNPNPAEDSQFSNQAEINHNSSVCLTNNSVLFTIPLTQRNSIGAEQNVVVSICTAPTDSGKSKEVLQQRSSTSNKTPSITSSMPSLGINPQLESPNIILKHLLSAPEECKSNTNSEKVKCTETPKISTKDQTANIKEQSVKKRKKSKLTTKVTNNKPNVKSKRVQNKSNTKSSVETNIRNSGSLSNMLEPNESNLNEKIVEMENYKKSDPTKATEITTVNQIPEAKKVRHKSNAKLPQCQKSDNSLIEEPKRCTPIQTNFQIKSTITSPEQSSILTSVENHRKSLVETREEIPRKTTHNISDISIPSPTHPASLHLAANANENRQQHDSDIVPPSEPSPASTISNRNSIYVRSPAELLQKNHDSMPCHASPSHNSDLSPIPPISTSDLIQSTNISGFTRNSIHTIPSPNVNLFTDTINSTSPSGTNQSVNNANIELSEIDRKLIDSLTSQIYCSIHMINAGEAYFRELNQMERFKEIVIPNGASISSLYVMVIEDFSRRLLYEVRKLRSTVMRNIVSKAVHILTQTFNELKSLKTPKINGFLNLIQYLKLLIKPNREHFLDIHLMNAICFLCSQNYEADFKCYTPEILAQLTVSYRNFYFYYCMNKSYMVQKKNQQHHATEVNQQQHTTDVNQQTQQPGIVTTHNYQNRTSVGYYQPNITARQMPLLQPTIVSKPRPNIVRVPQYLHPPRNQPINNQTVPGSRTLSNCPQTIYQQSPNATVINSATQLNHSQCIPQNQTRVSVNITQTVPAHQNACRVNPDNQPCGIGQTGLPLSRAANETLSPLNQMANIASSCACCISASKTAYLLPNGGVARHSIPSMQHPRLRFPAAPRFTNTDPAASVQSGQQPNIPQRAEYFPSSAISFPTYNTHTSNQQLQQPSTSAIQPVRIDVSYPLPGATQASQHVSNNSTII